MMDHAITVRDVLYCSGAVTALVLFIGAIAVLREGRKLWRGKQNPL